MTRTNKMKEILDRMCRIIEADGPLSKEALCLEADISIWAYDKYVPFLKNHARWNTRVSYNDKTKIWSKKEVKNEQREESPISIQH